ncbi:MAG: RMD1 family protein [Gammaproteobacteria bacterium]|nr:RMD1 family protein [Gammaproteobacteria bacterium]
MQQPTLFAGKITVRVRALCVGERIDLRALEAAQRLAVAPLVVIAGAQGCAVLFRYGVVVLFDLDAMEEASFLSLLKPLINEPFVRPETEEAEISINPQRDERVEGGVVSLHAFSIERLQTVADILAKSVVLAHYEASIAGVFDRIEPLAASLQRDGSGGHQSKELLRHIGGTLLIQHKMVGRVEMGEKPEILWDRPDLDRLYLRLVDEYELRERHLALERKLELISRTVETLLDLLQHNRSLRVEWYIVILIVVEILLTLYTMFSGGG